MKSLKVWPKFKTEEVKQTELRSGETRRSAEQQRRDAAANCIQTPSQEEALLTRCFILK